MKKIKTTLILILSWIMYLISFLFPRDKYTWIFVGWYKNATRETFADNSKYLFLHVSNNHKNINAIWIANDNNICTILRSRGYKAHSINSFWGIYYSLRAGHTIIDAVMQTVNWQYSGRSSVTQLWHADGIKKLNLSSKWSFDKKSQLFKSPGLFRFTDSFIASSDYIAKKFIMPSFEVAREQVHITGLPRYDTFFKHIPGQEIDIHEKLKKELSELKDRGVSKIIFYGPTFRRGKTLTEQLAHLHLQKLNKFLAKKNYHLFISLHPKFSSSAWIPKKSLSNISYSNAEFDIYPLLPQFDLLITDYSSTCLEFLLLDKPTIFYVYDFEEYKKDPGIPEEFWNLIPGPRVKTLEKLLASIGAEDTMQEERKHARDILFTFTKGNASENVTQEILKKI